MERKLGAVAVVAALVLASGVAAGAASETSQPESESDASSRSTPDFGGIPPEIMEAQATISEIGALVDATDVDHQIATTGNDHAKRQLIVYVAGTPPKAMLDLANGGLPPQFDGYGIDIRSAGHSMDQMKAAMDRAADTMTQDGFPNRIAMMHANQDGSGITVILDPKLVGDFEASELEPKYTAWVGMAVTVEEGQAPIPARAD